MGTTSHPPFHHDRKTRTLHPILLHSPHNRRTQHHPRTPRRLRRPTRSSTLPLSRTQPHATHQHPTTSMGISQTRHRTARPTRHSMALTHEHAANPRFHLMHYTRRQPTPEPAHGENILAGNRRPLRLQTLCLKKHPRPCAHRTNLSTPSTAKPRESASVRASHEPSFPDALHLASPRQDESSHRPNRPKPR